MSYSALKGHLLPKIGGFLLFPAAGALATRALAPLIVKRMSGSSPAEVDNTVALIAGVCHAAGAFAAYQVSERSHSIGTEAFARGGMWAEMVCAAAVPALTMIEARAPSANAMPVPSMSSNAVSSVLRPKEKLRSFLQILTANAAADAASKAAGGPGAPLLPA